MAIASSPLFSADHWYALAEDPPAISPLRLDILLLDHTRADSKLHVARKVRDGDYRHAPRGRGTISIFRFLPCVPLYPQPSTIGGCLRCGGERDIGKYTCLEHPECDTPEERLGAVMRLGLEVQELEGRFPALEAEARKGPPAELKASFVEKGVQYNLTLTLCPPAAAGRPPPGSMKREA